MHKIVKLLLISLLFVISLSCSNQSNKNDHVNKIESSSKNSKKAEITISAAVSLKDVLSELQSTFEKKHPTIKITFNFGASGSLQQQIIHGAPVDLFFSAAEDKFDTLVNRGIISKQDRINVVGNNLVLVVPSNTNTVVQNFNDLTNKEVKKVSIGTPEFVPAGKYAKEVFENMEIWDSVKTKIVYAKDVRQVLSYVETKNVTAGVVYKTDALNSDKIRIVMPADTKTYTPINYPLGIIKNTSHPKEAKELFEFLTSEHAHKVYIKYGFSSKIEN
jgi:molybdate transport system substrate-binding protein